MKKIENGYFDYYYLTEDGRLYNDELKEYKTHDKNYKLSIKRKDGVRKKVSLKKLYYLVYNKPYCKDNIDDLNGEEWKEIDNANGLYFVSNKGRIKSYNGYDAILLKPYKTTNGYNRVDIVQDGIRVSRLVHRLVGLYFLPFRSREDVELHHIDFDKDNNKCSNLIWLTVAEHKKVHKERKKQNA